MVPLVLLELMRGHVELPRELRRAAWWRTPWVRSSAAPVS